MFVRTALIFVFTLGIGAGVIACATPSNEDDEVSEDALRMRTSAGADPVWIYSGEMPSLENVTIFVSTKGHTARVVGDLPLGFRGSLPDYAVKETVHGKERAQVTYPIATIDRSLGRPNAAAGIYGDLIVYPYTPQSAGSAPWGGFPYIEYERARSIAFHGPITSEGRNWRLLRGPVSHGCNRMQGEHAVELAHLIGANMTKKHAASASVIPNASNPNRAKVVVLPHNEYDKITDGSLTGKFVDVDYAPTIPSIAVSASSPVSSYVFKTWNGDQHPNWICIADEARLDQPKPCAHLAPNPTTDVASGSHRANGKVCNVEQDVNVRDASLGSVIGKALADERLERSGRTARSASGIEFEQVWLFANPAIGAPEGFGWIARRYLCDD